MNFSKQKNWDFIICSFDKFFFSTALLSKVKQCWKNLSNERMMKFDFFFEKSKSWIQFFGQSAHLCTWKMWNLEFMVKNQLKQPILVSEKWWDLFTYVSKKSHWNHLGHIKHCALHNYVSLDSLKRKHLLQKVTLKGSLGETW